MGLALWQMGKYINAVIGLHGKSTGWSPFPYCSDEAVRDLDFLPDVLAD